MDSKFHIRDHGHSKARVRPRLTIWKTEDSYSHTKTAVPALVIFSPEEVVHASQNVTNLLPFSTLEGSRCRLVPVLSGLQECNYVTLQYKQVMTHAHNDACATSSVFSLSLVPTF